MFIYTQTFRAKSPEDAEQICRLIRQNDSLSVEPGHYRSSCYAEIDDPRTLHVFSLWTSVEALSAWMGSWAHQQIHDQLRSHIDGPETAPKIYREVW